MGTATPLSPGALLPSSNLWQSTPNSPGYRYASDNLSGTAAGNTHCDPRAASLGWCGECGTVRPNSWLPPYPGAPGSYTRVGAVSRLRCAPGTCDRRRLA